MKTEQAFHNGRYHLKTIAHEMRMSHWVDAPLLTDTQTNEVVLNLADKIWDFREAHETESGIDLLLARYPNGRKRYLLSLDLQNNQATIKGITCPISDINDTLFIIR